MFEPPRLSHDKQYSKGNAVGDCSDTPAQVIHLWHMTIAEVLMLALVRAAFRTSKSGRGIELSYLGTQSGAPFSVADTHRSSAAIAPDLEGKIYISIRLF